MNWDMPVLFGSLLAILLSFVWSRATTIGPVLFAWAGAAAGGTVAFVRHYDMAKDQVGIDHIVPSAAFGAACGLLPGFAVRAHYLRGGHRCKVVLEAISAAALSAGLGLVFGWIGHRRNDDAVSSALGYGAAFAAIGALLALVNWRLRRRQANAEPGAEPEPARTSAFRDMSPPERPRPVSSFVRLSMGFMPPDIAFHGEANKTAPGGQ
jgi:hypothetical protein